MAGPGRPKKTLTQTTREEKNPTANDHTIDDYVNDLVSALNKEHGERIAYNLATDISPTHVERWISTSCMQLDYCMSNRRNGGAPEGR